MFGKLLKNDLRATARTQCWAIGLSFGIALLTFGCYLLMRNYALGGLLSGLLLLLLASCVPLISLIFIVIWFYKTSYGKEGYFTRLLPVDQKKVFTSKTLTAYFWYLLATLLSLLMIAAVAGIFIHALEQEEGMPSTAELWQLVIATPPRKTLVAFAVFIPVYILIATLSAVVLYEFVICAGNGLRGFRNIGKGSPVLVFILVYLGSILISNLNSLIPLTVGLDEELNIVLRDVSVAQAVMYESNALCVPLLTLAAPVIFLPVGFFLSRKWYADRVDLR